MFGHMAPTLLHVLVFAQATLVTDRRWDVLPAEGLAAQLAAAASCFQSRTLDLDGLAVDAKTLRVWSAAAQDPEPTRALREVARRPLRPEGLVRLLDDLCRAPALERPTLTGGRARKSGIFVSVGAVFEGELQRYGGMELAVDPPLDYRSLDAPEDGTVVSSRWAARYLEPESDDDKLAMLRAANSGFAGRVVDLVKQLQAHGATVVVESAVRSRARGYLLFGSYWLSRSQTPAEIAHRQARLTAYQSSWAQGVDIDWHHPDGPEASVRAARALADTFGVVYATYRGARNSKHYDGEAVDLSVVGLPRRLRLKAPDGALRSFDLSGADEPRDLSLTPVLVDWIELHFGLRKLRRDYPHWSDAS